MRAWHLVLLLTLPGAILVCVMLYGSPDRVTRENGVRVGPDMTVAAVRSVLGPPGDYTTGPVRPDGAPKFATKTPDGPVMLIKEGWRVEDWNSDSAIIWVMYDEYGIVKCRMMTPAMKEQQSIFDNLAWRAKRQWRKWFSSN